MNRKLTITIDPDVYDGLYKVIGARRISRFIEDLARPHVVAASLDAAYAGWLQTGPAKRRLFEDR